jgi:hypothetical protein
VNTLNDLCETFEDMAGESDGFGMIEVAQASAARIRRRRRIAGAAAAAMLVAVVAVAVPVTAERLRATDAPAAAPAPYRAPSEITLGVQPVPGFFVLDHGTDATRQFLTVRNRNTSAADHGGTVNVYDPGTFDPAVLQGGERVTVAGHPAYLVPTLTPGGPARAGRQATVGWQDTSGAWVIVTGAADRAALLRLAESVRLGPPRRLTAPVQFDWLPDGLPLSWASGSGETGGISGYELGSYVGFAAGRSPATDPLVPDVVARRGLALSAMAMPKTSRGWTELVAQEGAPPGKVPTPVWETIGGQRAWYLPDNATPNLFAAGPGAHLLIDVGDCGVVLQVADLGQISRAELVRTVAGMTFSSCTDAKTWQPVLS